MDNNNVFNLSRRKFLVQGVSAGAGLTLGVALLGCSDDKTSVSEAGPGIAGDTIVADKAYDVNAFVRIGTDDTVTVIMKHLEMGQGSHTGMATLVAEELDANWDQIEYQAAPADAKRYNNLFWGPMQAPAAALPLPMPICKCAKPAPRHVTCWLLRPR